MNKPKIHNDLFAADVPLVDGIIEHIVLLPDQAKVHFRTEQGEQATFTFEQTVGVWDRRAVGQEIGGLSTLPVALANLYIRELLHNDVEFGELDQQTLDHISVYSFTNSWSEMPILEIAATEMLVQRGGV
ncbi:hypothetical protein SK066_13415 [Paenibacillus hunanensis]|uniref:hypothetical protein n=1 Tax=Paenibacillus hunanensis TaxID=539262 RepID=UPI002A6A5CAF|nr:hypothetical protein [Paenibacillus hunanensis]WPP39625.1 hypothetical protein SK066_13415 [Paenibacillus hunanensis]